MLRTASSRFAASSRVNSSTNCISLTTSAARFAAASSNDAIAISGARHISGVSPSTSQLPPMAARSAAQSASISTATMRSSRNKTNNNNNLAFLPVSVSAVLSQTAQGLLAKQQREISSRVESSSTGSSKDLFRNIYFSNDASRVDKEGPQYVEVTQNELRLEFLDASKDYKQTAALMFDDDRRDSGEVPSCFIPRQVENNISHGAGATIVLDKQQVLDYFRSQSANL